MFLQFLGAMVSRSSTLFLETSVKLKCTPQSCAQFRMNIFTVLLALGEKGGELNSKIHSSVKKVVSVLEAQAIFRNMNRNLQKCRNASQALQ